MLEILILIIYIFSIAVLFIFAAHYIFILYFYIKTKNKSISLPQTLKHYPDVTIQLPLYNEKYVAKRLIESVIKIDYPIDKLEIQVLDDSNDETVDICKNLVSKYRLLGHNIHYIHRKIRIGYKAGALKEGLANASGEYIAIFDADFVPKVDFLKRTLSYFNDKKIGMVQTRWEHINREQSWITKAQAIALDAHFSLEQEVRNRAGFFINFNGTAGIWRKSCIIDSGNWHYDTLTEDFDLSYRAQLRGWKFIYLNDFTSPAELPSDINSLKIQQFRWAKGAIETCLKLLPTILKSDIKPIVKLESIFHLTGYLVFPFILIVAGLNIPILMIKISSNNYDSIFAFMSLFIIASLATLLFYTVSQRNLHRDWKKKIIYFPFFLIGSLGMAVNNTKAVMEALIGKKSDFHRTPKNGCKKIIEEKINDYWESKSVINIPSLIEIIFSLYFVLGIIFSVLYNDFGGIPFQILFMLSYGIIGFYSLKEKLRV